MDTNVELSLWTLLGQAGWTMAPIYACSVIGAALFIRKLVEQVSAKIGNGRLLLDPGLMELLELGDLEDARALCLADKSALGNTMAFCIDTLRTRPARAEEETVRYSTAALAQASATISALAFIAQVSPLFGLLGTVIGMVDLFSSMEASGHDADTAVLSSGIWKALLTTAAGLIVGIPALAAHAWLSSRVEALRQQMEDGTGRILNRFLGAPDLGQGQRAS